MGTSGLVVAEDLDMLANSLHTEVEVVIVHRETNKVDMEDNLFVDLLSQKPLGHMVVESLLDYSTDFS